MRRQLITVFVAISVMVAVAFVVPLGFLVRTTAEDRAIDAARCRCRGHRPCARVGQHPEPDRVGGRCHAKRSDRSH